MIKILIGLCLLAVTTAMPDNIECVDYPVEEWIRFLDVIKMFEFYK